MAKMKAGYKYGTTAKDSKQFNQGLDVNVGVPSRVGGYDYSTAHRADQKTKHHEMRGGYDSTQKPGEVRKDHAPERRLRSHGRTHRAIS